MRIKGTLLLLMFGLSASACTQDASIDSDQISLRLTPTTDRTPPLPAAASTMPALPTTTLAPPYPADPLPSLTLPPTATAIQAMVDPTVTPTPTLPAPYPAQSSPHAPPAPYPAQTSTTAPPTASPTFQLPEVERPADPLDTSSRDSVLQWLHYAFASADLGVIEVFLQDQVPIGVVSSEYFTSLGRLPFLQELAARLPQGVRCDGYEMAVGDINVLWIATSGWDPEWQFDPPVGTTADLVWILNDQGSAQGDFLLEGVAAGRLVIGQPCP